ncbi:hypothetical protein RSP795_10185 [Ralstonia solanacearum]|uniref:hypothetical protein n=1 Tax=Ralstonia solanacearum TaxID=305 RepID=UPI0007D773F8|nr:hypothetical protein [Ralstonia solanacearum]OAI62799.1 hypothetical protein RSP795_10185 [Ralstonia solanacearum]
MTAGITVVNDWGTVQVDENWATMSLRHKLSVAVLTLTVNSGRQGYDGSVTFAASSPMLFWKASVPTAIRNMVSNGDGTWTLTLRANAQASVVLYVFDTPEWASQNYGIEVFNASGVKVFGDQLRPLKIAAIVPVSAMPFVWDGLTPGNYAVNVGGGVRYESYAADRIRAACWTAGAMDRPAGGQLDWTVIISGAPFEVASVQRSPQFLIIADVTGL